MSVYERILLMGGPDTGKSHQMLSVVNYVTALGKTVHILDLEDKLEATLGGLGELHPNASLSVAMSWEEMRKSINDLMAFQAAGKPPQPGNWVMVDRVDLAWPAVQRWFSSGKHHEELADKLMKSSQGLKGSSMFTPSFDQGGWQVVNEQYDTWIGKILYGLRCNVLLTSGVRGAREGEVSPFEVFSHLGITPRGQKELAHQPHSCLMLYHLKEGTSLVWRITTAKDLPGRERLDGMMLTDFALEYLANYYKG